MPASLLIRPAATALLWSALVIAPLQALAAPLDQAQAHWWAGRQEQAMAVLQSALEQQPQEPKWRFALAWMATERKEWARAETLLRGLIEDYPDHAEAHNNLAVVLAQRGDLDGALNALQRAIALQPQSAAAQENLGDLHLQMALRAFKSAAAAGTQGAAKTKFEQLAALLKVQAPR